MSTHISTSSTALMEKNLVDEFYPIRAPLSGKYKKTFGYITIGFRLPVTITKIIDQLSRDKNEIQETHGIEARAEIKDIVGRLAKLKNELQTNKTIACVGSSPQWNNYILQIAARHHNNIDTDVTYYFSPWLFVECYIYHRIHQAFYSTIHLKDYDYVRKQKQDNFRESAEQALVLGEYVLSSKSTEKTLQSLLEVALWGNQCDLSLSSGESNSQTSNLLDRLHELQELILCNNSEETWKELKIVGAKQKSIGYILDNAGFELFTDLCFADLLLNEVDRIDFYVKDIPWFISDATSQDFKWLIQTIETSDKETFRLLGQKWKAHTESSRWRIINSNFWTLPHTFNEMEVHDPSLYSSLSEHNLLIFKGDLNYRKLVGDINWEPETPFKDALRGFLPAPLVALRTCKADTVAGLKNGLAEETYARDPDWLITGKYGLIQFAR